MDPNGAGPCRPGSKSQNSLLSTENGARRSQSTILCHQTAGHRQMNYICIPQEPQEKNTQGNQGRCEISNKNYWDRNKSRHRER